MATASQRLAVMREALALVRLGRSGGKVGIELYNFLSAIVGPRVDGTLRRGLNVWMNAKRYYETLVDKPCSWPKTFKGNVSGLRDMVVVVLFDPDDLGDVMRCVLPKMQAHAFFAMPGVPEALRSFLRERGVGAEVFDEYLKNILSEMAEVTAAFGTHQIRTTRVPEITSELLVACDDILSAIGVQEPRHDWEHWLRMAVEGGASQGFQVCPNSDTPETPVKPLEKNAPLLPSKKLEGSSNAIRVRPVRSGVGATFQKI
jgi:hypothetical protein